MSCSLNNFYAAVGIKKQNFHRKVNQEMKKADQFEQLHRIVSQVRSNHPRMSVRKIHGKLKPEFIGRDQFIAYCREQGWMIKIKRNYRRTTHSVTTRFTNLIANKWVTGVNQVWVSDITYIDHRDRFCYATFITDLYSRKIIGYSLSSTLRTIDTTLPALQMALKNRKGQQLSGLIFHSDGGGQYYEQSFIALLKENGITSSMAYSVYENAHAESLNGIIKNEYLHHYTYTSKTQVQRILNKVIYLYNNDRPHGNLKMKTPNEIELKKFSFKVKISSYNKRKLNYVTPSKTVINI
jgi:transposase InsO family protein